MPQIINESYLLPLRLPPATIVVEILAHQLQDFRIKGRI